MITTKRAHLRRLQGPDGYFRILAVDHCAVFSGLMQGALRRTPGEEEIHLSKEDVIRALSPFASAVLVDPAYASRSKTSQSSQPEFGLLISIEGSDYSTQDFRRDYLMPGITVRRIKEMGADCVKLFLYYRPDSHFAAEQRELIGRIADNCSAEQIPFLVEPIVFPLGPERLSPEEKAELSLEVVRDLRDYDIDVLKIEFPGDLQAFPKEKNLEICRSVTDAAQCPWIIPSSGAAKDALSGQLAISIQAGGRGFAIGRTVWQPYLTAPIPEKQGKRNAMAEQFSALCRIN